MLEEIYKNKVNIKILVYTHIMNDEIDRLIVEKGAKVIHKKPATATVDGMEEMISEIKNITSLIP
jgi:hypothetical protein